MEVVKKIVNTLGITTKYLLGSSGAYVADAYEKGGVKEIKAID